MAVNVTNIDGMIRAFAIKRLQEKLPNLDLSENSAFDDLVLKPVIEIVKPLFEHANSMELKQNLNNYDLLTEDELDEIGDGNYFIERKCGIAASTIETLIFSGLEGSAPLVIPSGVIFSTEDGFRYLTVNRTTFSTSELTTYYNSITGNHELPVAITAENYGTEYNVAAGRINICSTPFNTNMISCTNLSDVTNGTNKETNAEYAERIRNFYISRNLGTEDGYISYIKENFPEVTDIYVSGFGDQFMTRDLVNLYDPSTGNYYTKHWGGKVDLYLRNCIYGEMNKTITLNSNCLILSKPYSSIDATSITVVNRTDTTKTVTILSQSVETIDGVERMKLILNNAEQSSFDDTIVNDMFVTYNYTNDIGVTMSQIDNFNVGTTSAPLNSPVISISSMRYEKNGEDIPNLASHYVLTKTGEIGTTKEQNIIKLTDFESEHNGTNIVVSYLVNMTLMLFNTNMETGHIRMTTEDILAREMQPTYVNLYLKVSLRSGYNIGANEKIKIRNAILNYFSTVKGNIQESDIVNAILSDKNISAFLNYVALPFASFYIPEQKNDALIERRDGTSLSIDANSYPELNILEISVL